MKRSKDKVEKRGKEQMRGGIRQKERWMEQISGGEDKRERGGREGGRITRRKMRQKR